MGKSLRIMRNLVAIIALAAAPLLGRAAEPIKFEQETLANGLRVIYAPLAESPVVHVRVLYHVGSRDEREDRQGFAHMFEHMMFRGSAHVKPEEHMRTINTVGGYSNAFTSFDQTVYINTVPAAYLETALYLEADRMASFRVSPEIFATERNVVAEEWRLRQNQPYGTVYEELLKRVFTKHPYRWTPIGNMDHLRAASTHELQAFFNTYYMPPNAVLVIAGKFDTAEAKQMVKRYYAWIPGSEKLPKGTRPSMVWEFAGRDIPHEPEQTGPRRAEIGMKVPLARVMVVYPMPPIKSDDNDALSVLSSILGDGRSSRLSRALVTSKTPLCTQAGSMAMGLEDGGTIGASATVLDGKSIEEVEKVLRNVMAEIRDNGVTAEELEKAKVQARIYLASRRETAESVASELGQEALFRNDPARVNTEEERLNAITVKDIQAVAQKYWVDARSTTLIIKPDPAAGRSAAGTQAATATAPLEKTEPYPVAFPKDFPASVPLPASATRVTFAKGTEKDLAGVKVLVMPDRRIPLVHFSLTMRMGDHAEPAGKEGLGSLTAGMLRRGPTGTSYNAFNEDLESRGIRLEILSAGDTTRISGSCLPEQLSYTLSQARRVLLEPALAPEEFAKLKAQTLSQIRLSLNSPTTVAEEEMARLVYGETPLGRSVSPESIAAITLEDVKKYYETIYRPAGAIILFSGDVGVAEGQKLAGTLLDGWKAGELPKVDYKLPPTPTERKILLIDRPESRQSNVRLGIRAYAIHSDEKYAGSLAGQILSMGIDSRLGRYVRAQRGLAYGVYGVFQPTRQDGSFAGSTDTKVETTGAAVDAIFHVLEQMRMENVTDKELTDAKLRVAGQMAMQTQTIQQQASRRVEGILNGYPIDYFDNYAERVGKVTADEIRAVMQKYVDAARMAIVVVGPADAVKPQLEKLGPVTVEPMPLARKKAEAK